MGTDLVTKLRAAGITLSLDGGNLVATPKAAITDELRSLIRAHKADILAALAQERRPPSRTSVKLSKSAPPSSSATLAFHVPMPSSKPHASPRPTLGTEAT